MVSQIDINNMPQSDQRQFSGYYLSVSLLKNNILTAMDEHTKKQINTIGT
jgi:hypothetical protein